MKLSVRTFAHSGLLFYMANANQQDYAVLQLQAGRLLLSCDLGKGPASATLPAAISDGLWHTVSSAPTASTMTRYQITGRKIYMWKTDINILNIFYNICIICVQVKAEFGKKSVMVSVDGSDSDRIATKGHTLDVEGKLYLGGLPATYTAKRIGNVTDVFPFKSSLK